MGELTKQQTQEQQLLVEFHKLFAEVEPRSPAHEALVDLLMLEDAKIRLPKGTDMSSELQAAINTIRRNTYLDSVRPDGYAVFNYRFSQGVLNLRQGLHQMNSAKTTSVLNALIEANLVVSTKEIQFPQRSSNPAPTTIQSPIK